jgi:hypothetical protein
MSKETNFATVVIEDAACSYLSNIYLKRYWKVESPERQAAIASKYRSIILERVDSRVRGCPVTRLTLECEPDH